MFEDQRALEEYNKQLWELELELVELAKLEEQDNQEQERKIKHLQ